MPRVDRAHPRPATRRSRPWFWRCSRLLSEGASAGSQGGAASACGVLAAKVQNWRNRRRTGGRAARAIRCPYCAIARQQDRRQSATLDAALLAASLKEPIGADNRAPVLSRPRNSRTAVRLRALECTYLGARRHYSTRPPSCLADPRTVARLSRPGAGRLGRLDDAKVSEWCWMPIDGWSRTCNRGRSSC